MRNINDFIDGAALELAYEMDQVDLDYWGAWNKWALSTKHEGPIIRSFYGDQPGDERDYRAIKRAIKAKGYTVKVCKLGRTILGTQLLGDIEIRPRLQAGLRISVLLHEWTHGILHKQISDFAWQNFYKWRGELEAEATSFIVCRALGYHPPQSAHYIRATYGRTVSDLLEVSLADIRRAATEIIEALSAAGLC